MSRRMSRVWLAIAVAVAILLPVAPGRAQSTTVTMWAFPLSANDQALYRPIVQSFEASNPGLKVNIEVLPWAGRMERMLAAVSADATPDLIYLNTDFFAKLVEINALENIGPKVPKAVVDDYLPSTLTAPSYKGRLYGRTNLYGLPILTSVFTNAYNVDILERSGLNPNRLPTTWAEFEQFLKAMSKPAQNQWGAQFNLKRASPVTTFVPFLWQAGGEVYAPDGRTCAFNSPQGVRALEFMISLFKNNYAQQANITGGGDQFTSGRIGALVQAEPNDFAVIKQQAPNLRVAIGPTLKDARQVNFGTVGSYAIFSKSKSKDAALKWILHITEPRNMVGILKAGNFISPRKSLRAEEYAATPEFRRIVEEVKYARPEPVSFFAREVLTAMTPELETAFLGLKAPKQALDAAVLACNNLLKQPIR